MNTAEIIDAIKNCRVLYVEDDAFQMQQTLSVLSMFFNEIMTSCDADEALEKFQKNSFDLLLCDIALPKMSGVELAKKIRATDNEVDFIFISASKEIMDFKNAIEIQALDFLMKPYSFEDFKNALIKFAKKRAMESSNIIDINDTIKYDKLKRCIITKNGEIELTLKEQKLIRLAAQFRCKIITYDQIALALDHEEVNLTSIKNIILRLRKKLPTDIFSNMMGVGYRVVC